MMCCCKINIIKISDVCIKCYTDNILLYMELISLVYVSTQLLLQGQFAIR